MNKDWLLWLAVVAILIGAGTGFYIMSRGIRNNNPGNIRHGASKWQGMSIEQTDTAFIQFDDPVYGIRAMTKLLTNYQSRYGLDTISELIGRWAPPNENITSAYIAAVSKNIGVSADHKIDVVKSLPQLVPAIIFHENGKQPYSSELIAEGIALA